MTIVSSVQGWASGVTRSLLPVIAALSSGYAVLAQADSSLDCLIEPYRVVDLSSPEIGVLGSVQVDEADVVHAGDVVAALHDKVERAALKLSRARAAAHAEIDLLRHDHEFNTRKRTRFDQLQNKLAVSTQGADEVRTAEELARLRLGAAKEKQNTVQLEASRDALALERRTVRSPFSGVVAKRYKNAGEYVDGDPIVQLVQLDPLRVQVVAPIAMFGQISVGMNATVLPELPIAGNFEASVISIDPVMDAATATFGVRLSLPNPEQRLPPGLKCTLVLHAQSEPVRETGQSPSKPAVAYLAPSPVTPSAQAPVSTANVTDQQVTAHSSESPPAEQCATLGPISSDIEADAIAASLVASDILFAHRYTGGKTTTARWVVLSSPIDSSPATLIDRVKAANIADYQLLMRGTWKNRVSFGTYSGQQSASRRLRQIEELGFSAELLNRDRHNLAIWLDMTRHPSDPPFASLLSAVLNDRPALTVKPIPCTQLASR